MAFVDEKKKLGTLIIPSFLNGLLIFLFGVIISTFSIFLVLVFFSKHRALFNQNINLFAFIICTVNILISAIVEELIYRFLLFKILLKKVNIIVTMFISSTLFCFSHYQPEVPRLAMIGYFLGGITYSLAFIAFNFPIKYRLYYLYFPISIHFGWNSAQNIFFGFLNNRSINNLEIVQSIFSTEIIGGIYFTGGSYGFEGGLLQIYSRIILIGILLMFLIISKK